MHRVRLNTFNLNVNLKELAADSLERLEQALFAKGAPLDKGQPFGRQLRVECAKALSLDFYARVIGA
jgi:hypothetical protein